MKQNKFKIGDRVAAYNCTQRYEAVVRDIDDRHSPVLLVIETDDDTLSVHPKQCRLLKKKEGRRLYAQYNYLTKELVSADPLPPQYMINTNELVEFVEVRKRK